MAENQLLIQCKKCRGEKFKIIPHPDIKYMFKKCLICGENYIVFKKNKKLMLLGDPFDRKSFWTEDKTDILMEFLVNPLCKILASGKKPRIFLNEFRRKL